MKFKLLAVLTLVVFGCAFASAQTFGFGTAGGDYLYCNYEVLSNSYGAPYAIWGGTDNISDCYFGSHYNATMGGVTGKLTKPQDPFGIGTVNGVVLGDNLYDAYSFTFTGYQWTVVSNLRCTNLGAKKPKEGWVGIASVSGFAFAGNYGVLSCTVYAKGQAKPNKGVSFGKSAALLKKR